MEPLNCKHLLVFVCKTE